MAVPGPLDLAKMHAAELKDRLEQQRVLTVLIRQIMVGRLVKVPAYICECTVTEIKLEKGGNIALYGTLKGKKKVYQLVNDIKFATRFEPEVVS